MHDLLVRTGESQKGLIPKIKTMEQVSNATSNSPFIWFRKGVEAALLAPTAIGWQSSHSSCKTRKELQKVGFRSIKLLPEGKPQW